MMVTYSERLVAVATASFFVLWALLAVAVNLGGASAVRVAQRMEARTAACFLLMLRLSPLVMALVLVSALCVPSYLSYEPLTAVEGLGFSCLGAVLLGACLLCSGAGRAARAGVHSFLYARRTRMASRKMSFGEGLPSVWVMDGHGPLVMVAGVVRPRIFLSRRVVEELPNDQLVAAIRHEQAHRKAFDNLKRMALLLASVPVRMLPGFDLIERAWERSSEWAADDQATAGSAQESVLLAEALVSVARLGAQAPPPALVATLIPHSVDLSERVDRLLRCAPSPNATGLAAILVVGSVLMLAFFLAVFVSQPVALSSVHRLLEFWMD